MRSRKGSWGNAVHALNVVLLALTPVAAWAAFQPGCRATTTAQVAGRHQWNQTGIHHPRSRSPQKADPLSEDGDFLGIDCGADLRVRSRPASRGIPTWSCCAWDLSSLRDPGCRCRASFGRRAFPRDVLLHRSVHRGRLQARAHRSLARVAEDGGRRSDRLPAQQRLHRSPRRGQVPGRGEPPRASVRGPVPPRVQDRSEHRHLAAAGRRQGRFAGLLAGRARLPRRLAPTSWPRRSPPWAEPSPSVRIPRRAPRSSPTCSTRRSSSSRRTPKCA